MRLGDMPIIALALSVVVLAALIDAARSSIDRTAVLRFIAPTAFETRSIEEILDGGGQ